MKQLFKETCEEIGGIFKEAGKNMREGFADFKKYYKVNKQRLWMYRDAINIAKRINEDTGYVFEYIDIEEWVDEIIDLNYNLISRLWDESTKDSIHEKMDEKLANEAGVVMRIIDVNTGRTVEYVKDL